MGLVFLIVLAVIVLGRVTNIVVVDGGVDVAAGTGLVLAAAGVLAALEEFLVTGIAVDARLLEAATVASGLAAVVIVEVAGGGGVVAEATFDGMVVDTLAEGTAELEKVVVLVVEELAARDNEGVVGYDDDDGDDEEVEEEVPNLAVGDNEDEVEVRVEAEIEVKVVGTAPVLPAVGGTTPPAVVIVAVKVAPEVDGLLAVVFGAGGEVR